MATSGPLRKVWKLLAASDDARDRERCHRLLHAMQTQEWWPDLPIRICVLHDDDVLCMWLTDAAWMRLEFVAWTVGAGTPQQYNIPLDTFDDDERREYLARVGDPDGAYSALVGPARKWDRD